MFIRLSHEKKYFLVLSPPKVVCVYGVGLEEVSFNSKISSSGM